MFSEREAQAESATAQAIAAATGFEINGLTPSEASRPSGPPRQPFGTGVLAVKVAAPQYVFGPGTCPPTTDWHRSTSLAPLYFDVLRAFGVARRWPDVLANALAPAGCRPAWADRAPRTT